MSNVVKVYHGLDRLKALHEASEAMLAGYSVSIYTHEEHGLFSVTLLENKEFETSENRY